MPQQNCCGLPWLWIGEEIVFSVKLSQAGTDAD